MKPPVDSKGAAIDKVIEALCVGVINANVLSLREQLDIDRELKAHAKQAILAILAQEVKRAYEQGQKDGYSPGIKPTKMTIEQIREYNRLAKRRSRRKAGLV